MEQTSKLDAILKKLEALENQGEKTEKEYKLGAMKRMGDKRKIKKNYALTHLLMTNGNIKTKFNRIVDDEIFVKEFNKSYKASTNFVGYSGRYPTIIISEWDLLPISRESLYTLAQEGRLAIAQDTTIHNIERAMGLLKKKKTFGGAGMILLIIGIGAVLYFLYQAII